MANQQPTEAQSEYLSGTRIAKLATLNFDGSPNVVPVWYDWDGAVARIFTDRKSPKVKRIRRDPRVSLTVEEPAGVPEKWVTIEGTAAIIESGGLALAKKLADRYYTPEKVAEVWAGWEAMKDDWIVLEITPKRFRGEA